MIAVALAAGATIVAALAAGSILHGPALAIAVILLGVALILDAAGHRVAGS